PFTSSTMTLTTSNCSAGVKEYSSPVPPAATTALIECLSSTRRFLRKPFASSDKSELKGVTGNAITPRSLLRISVSFILTTGEESASNWDRHASASRLHRLAYDTDTSHTALRRGQADRNP